MYEERKNKTSIVSIILRIIILILILILCVEVISLFKKDKQELESNIEANVEELDKYNQIYFENKLPTEVGKSNKVSLDELVDLGLIEVIKDEYGNKCDMKSSFIEVIRLETQYQYKSYLKCDGDYDYKNTFVDIKDDNTTTTTTTSTTTTKKTTSTTKTTSKKTTTTTKVTTTTLKYTISFNSNGGNYIEDIKVLPGKSLDTLPIPERNGYIFVGWYNGTTKVTTLTNINENRVLTAKWIKK